MWDCDPSEQAASVTFEAGASPNAFAMMHLEKLELTSELLASIAPYLDWRRSPEFGKIDLASSPARHLARKKVNAAELNFPFKEAPIPARAPPICANNVTRLRRLCDNDQAQCVRISRLRQSSEERLSRWRPACAGAASLAQSADQEIFGSINASNAFQN
jgi:hypothetical protein